MLIQNKFPEALNFTTGGMAVPSGVAVLTKIKYILRTIFTTLLQDRATHLTTLISPHFPKKTAREMYLFPTTIT